MSEQQKNQKWKIGFFIPEIIDNDAEKIFSKVIKSMHEITDQYPQYKKYQAFKHYDNNKENNSF